MTIAMGKQSYTAAVRHPYYKLTSLPTTYHSFLSSVLKFLY